jgi:sterol desaturase/sphingolipid hydroxylase (fatty acid hydroxylase superfamily)
MMHHKHSYDDKKNEFILVPFKFQAALLLILSLLAIIDIYFVIGMLSFSLLYSYRHFAIHNNDNSSKFYIHHKIHHKKIKYNFSGIYPFIDTIFGTTRK